MKPRRTKAAASSGLGRLGTTWACGANGSATDPKAQPILASSRIDYRPSRPSGTEAGCAVSSGWSSAARDSQGVYGGRQRWLPAHTAGWVARPLVTLPTRIEPLTFTRARSSNRKRVQPKGPYPGNGGLVDARTPRRPGPQATQEELSYKAGASQAPRMAKGPATGLRRKGFGVSTEGECYKAL